MERSCISRCPELARASRSCADHHQAMAPKQEKTLTDLISSGFAKTWKSQGIIKGNVSMDDLMDRAARRAGPIPHCLGCPITPRASARLLASAWVVRASRPPHFPLSLSKPASTLLAAARSASGRSMSWASRRASPGSWRPPNPCPGHRGRHRRPWPCARRHAPKARPAVQNASCISLSR